MMLCFNFDVAAANSSLLRRVPRPALPAQRHWWFFMQLELYVVALLLTYQFESRPIFS